MSSKKYLKMNKKELLLVIQNFEKNADNVYTHVKEIQNFKDSLEYEKRRSEVNHNIYCEINKNNRTSADILEYVVDNILKPVLGKSIPLPIEEIITQLSLATSIILEEQASKYVERCKKNSTKIDSVKHELYLVNAGNKKMDVISTIRRYTNKDFEGVKNLVESCKVGNNVLIWECDDIKEATEVAERLKADGATTIYRPPWRDYIGMRKEPIKKEEVKDHE